VATVLSGAVMREPVAMPADNGSIATVSLRLKCNESGQLALGPLSSLAARSLLTA
jgi:hypothetical protein